MTTTADQWHAILCDGCPECVGLPEWWADVDYREGHAEMASRTCVCGATLTMRPVFGDTRFPGGKLTAHCDATGAAVKAIRDGLCAVRPTGQACQ